MSEFTKGKLEISENRDREGRQIVSIHNDDNKFPCIPIAIIEHGVAPTKEEAEANAKELVRRWNAFEEDGLVSELLNLCKEFMEIADNGSADFDDPVPGSIYLRAKVTIAKALPSQG